MPDEKSSSLSIKVDVAGVEALAGTVDKATEAGMAGAAAFLSRICLPVAEELGLLFQDRVSWWRQQNALKIAHKAEQLTKRLAMGDDVQAHPRLVHMALESGSWADTDEVQDMWAGLLASSLTKGGSSDDNLVFMNVLSQLTRYQAVIFNGACESAVKLLTSAGFVIARELIMDRAAVCDLAGCEDFHLVDFHLDHLRETGLLSPEAGFDVDSPRATLTPSPFGIQFYVRCQGFVGSPSEYFAEYLDKMREAQETTSVHDGAETTPPA